MATLTISNLLEAKGIEMNATVVDSDPYELRRPSEPDAHRIWKCVFIRRPSSPNPFVSEEKTLTVYHSTPAWWPDEAPTSVFITRWIADEVAAVREDGSYEAWRERLDGLSEDCKTEFIYYTFLQLDEAMQRFFGSALTTRLIELSCPFFAAPSPR